ncbi:MAG: hypothetical protein GWN94_21305, partial [Phycisphaerae bacterium]|nr:hypothetical protein [Phycisphaerae bacterium]
MKQLFYLIIGLFLFAQMGYGANVNIKDLPENTAPDSTDAIELDDGVNSEFSTLSNAIKKAHGLSDGLIDVSGGVMGTTADLDPDRLTGDTTDNDLVDV